MVAYSAASAFTFASCSQPPSPARTNPHPCQRVGREGSPRPKHATAGVYAAPPPARGPTDRIDPVAGAPECLWEGMDWQEAG